MVQRLREVLLTRYIGSILIALLCLQGLINFVETLAKTLVIWIINVQRVSQMIGSDRASYPWDRLVFAGVEIALYLPVAYWLAAWLYPPTLSGAAAPEINDENSTDGSRQS
ncbi:MAG: hypothetical protein ABSG70_10610 [Terriglobales bacterium]|jgi:hypothetical protein